MYYGRRRPTMGVSPYGGRRTATCGMCDTAAEVTVPEAYCDGALTVMAYVPVQPWEPLFEVEVGFDTGTVFPSLEKPFMRGGRNCGV